MVGLGTTVMATSPLGCTETREVVPAAPPATPAPPVAPTAAPASPEPPGSSAASDELRVLAQTIETHALRCEGAELEARLSALTPAQRVGLEAFTEAPSARLAAHWREARRFTEEGTLVPGAADSLASIVAEVTGHAPPRWWTDQLASARRPTAPDAVAGYDCGLGPASTRGGPGSDRRGPREMAPGGLLVRPAGMATVGVAEGRMFLDLSTSRVELGPAPTAPGTMIEHGRALGGSSIFYATFAPGAGGFRFPLHAVDGRGNHRWQAEVCGPDRQMLGGLGHLTVEIVVIASTSTSPPGSMPAAVEPRAVAVYSAESHGVALDVFDPATGQRTLAWSSEAWFGA